MLYFVLDKSCLGFLKFGQLPFMRQLNVCVDCSDKCISFKKMFLVSLPTYTYQLCFSNLCMPAPGFYKKVCRYHYDLTSLFVEGENTCSIRKDNS